MSPMSATLGNPPLARTLAPCSAVLSILIDGNRYSEIKRNKKGEIIELIPISAERVKKDHDRAEKGMILYKVSSSTGKM
jgi:phage portal protein BeeE